MSPVDLVRFATTALHGHRLRTVLSIVGVVIGVSSVILLTSLGEGARVYVTDEFTNLGSNLIIVIRGKTETAGMMVIGGAPHDLTIDDVEAIRRQVPQIRHLAPLTMGEVRARYGDRSREITVAGTTTDLRKVRDLALRAGRYLPETDPDRGPRVAVLGHTVALELFPGVNPLGEILRIGEERYRVIGVMAPRGMSVGMDLDELVHIPLGRAMRMFDQTSLFRVMIQVNSHEEIESVRERVRQTLIERHGGEEDVTLITQDSVLATFNQILIVLTLALGGIAAISLSVAGVGIMNVMLVSVSERTEEIGLLKAVGVSPGQVLLVFLVEAAFLSSIGGLLGVGVGLGAAELIDRYFPAFPVVTPPWAIWSALFVSLSIGILFGALPARRAAALDPVDALAGR